MLAGAPVVFLLAWLFFVGGIAGAVALVAKLGMSSLVWGYLTGAGSISLCNTAAGYLLGKEAQAPPLGQLLLAVFTCILCGMAWLVMSVCLATFTVLLLGAAGVMVVASAAAKLVHTASGWQQAQKTAQLLRTNAGSALVIVKNLWEVEGQLLLGPVM